MPYEGDKNYIFISYAHKDSQEVLPIIDALNKRGFRVWYDAGIEAGTEWPEYIEEHLQKASVVLVFMSPNAVESKNCRNEINFALDLDKDVLIAYLEDTTLLKGMRLQLNSTQSLFRKNHSTNETFIQELLNARLLQNCRDVSAEKEHITHKEIKLNKDSTTKISNICSIGANNENDLWPRGYYSQTINRDEYSVVFFHVSLLKPFGFSGIINNSFKIYNSENLLIFEEESTMQIESSHDKIAKGWILKGEDGSFVPSGEYQFVCSINNSPAFTYCFSVSSNGETLSKTSANKSFFDKIKKLFR